MGIAPNIYEKALRRDDYRCARCWSNQDLSLHHILHKEFGGTDRLDNLCCLCFNCHRFWHRTFQKNPNINFWLYLAEGGLIQAMREHNEDCNKGRMYTIRRANELIPYHTRNRRKTTRRTTKEGTVTYLNNRSMDYNKEEVRS